MENELYEFKIALLNTGYFKKQSGKEYVCTCPFCGKRKHCYVMFDLSNDTPLLYNCFRCNRSGIINKEFLEYFGLENMKIPKTKMLRKIDIANAISDSSKVVMFNVNNVRKIKLFKDYIKWRVGIEPDLDDLMKFQLITEPGMYAREYLGENYDDRWFETSIWFKLDNGNIHGRSLVDDEKRWIKFKSNRVRVVGTYSIKSQFDIETDINICIAEGIIDVIGLYYYNRLNDPCGNYVYIASLGKNYEVGIKNAITRGIFGDSVNIRIYKDSDVDNVWIDKEMCALFKSVSLYGNVIGHDYGVPMDQIDAKKIRKIK